MRNIAVKFARSALQRIGYDVRSWDTYAKLERRIVVAEGKLAELGLYGQDAHLDIKRILEPNSSPVLLDVGANVGQTINILRQMFLRPAIHAFEPGQTAFEELSRAHARTPGVRLNHLALGAKPSRQVFFENTRTDMSSFLPLGPNGWGEISGKKEIEVSTVDNYCSQNGIHSIDLLKSDTQGFDLEVMKGAQRLLDARKVRLLHIELTFQPLYKDLPPVDEILRFVSERGFELVSFYKLCYLNGRVGWTDALFVQPHFLRAQ